MTERSLPARVALPVPALLLSLGSLAGPGQDDARSARVVHLADRVAEARVETPLRGLVPAPDLGALEDPQSDLLLDEGFEDFDWDFAGWPRDPAARIEAGGAGGKGHALRITGVPEGYGWVLPVEPDCFYFFKRAVRVEGEPFCDLRVVESRLELEDVRVDSRRYFLAGRGDALKVHSLPVHGSEVGQDTGWQRASTSFYPTPRTRSLVVLLRPAAGADPTRAVRSMAFDDVRLEAVLPGRVDRVRLLAAAHAEPGVADPLGMRKAGWLLPLPSPEGVREGEPAEGNYDWRRALYVPPPTTLAFDLVPSPGAHLRLATGLALETPPGAAARFQVDLVAKGAEPRRLLDVVRTARLAEWNWTEADLDLAAWSGREVTLVLRTLAEEGDPHPLWADPRVEPDGSAGDPLVILIAVDTLRADRLSAYGYERPTSPALERLAAEGVRFDQARSNYNWTCPSFASIFTGLVPARHGVSSYGPATPLPGELVTLAEHFRGAGWATRSIAYKVPLFDGNYEQGFDRAFNVPRDVIRAEENLARALEWLEDRRGGPGFLFLHFNDPHQPFVQPEPFDRSFGPAPRSGLPMSVPGFGQEAEQTEFRDLYDGAVAYVDACIGRFLDALRERGLYDRAVIAFVADHGEQLWERGGFGHGGDNLYDEVVRVPLIVKPRAGTFEAGRVVAADVSGFDVMPTLLDLAGLPVPGDIDARSLVPLVRGERERLDRVVVTEAGGNGLALVDGGYKFVLRPGGTRESLYHLAEDPGEQHDVAGEALEVRTRLRGLAIAYLLEHRPGNYLLVHAGEADARLTVSSGTVRPRIGAFRLALEEAAEVVVELPARAWGLLEVEGEGDTVTVQGLETRGPGTGFAPWTTGRLATLHEPGVWRVHGPRPVAAVDTSAEPVDLEQLEALKRLGYAGD